MCVHIFVGVDDTPVAQISRPLWGKFTQEEMYLIASSPLSHILQRTLDSSSNKKATFDAPLKFATKKTTTFFRKSRVLRHIDNTDVILEDCACVCVYVYVCVYYQHMENNIHMLQSEGIFF